MGDNPPAPQVSKAPVEATQEQEPVSTFGDIMIFCHPHNVDNLVQSFETEIKHANGALPLFVLWSGISSVLHQGVIVLGWEGVLPAAFLQSLARDHEIFDYVPYDWIPSEDGEEQRVQNAQDQESSQVSR